MCNLNAPFFNDEQAAREYLEAQRWPDGPFCPHCGGTERIYPVKAKGKVRKGLYHCNDCEKQFTVTVGTVFERSKVPLHRWLMATYLLSSSKKGISAKQLERSLGVTYKTAWFMAHRIREAMREGKGSGFFNDPGMMGGNGSTVEADETYIGRKRSRKGEDFLPRGYGWKEKVITLVERDGRARSFHVPAVNAETVRNVLVEQINPNTKLYTDEARYYVQADKFLKSHEAVNHGIEEYVRGDVHTQTIENYFSILKRGLNGVYQHCSKQHLKRYLCEYDFRYNYREKLGYDDLARTNKALQGIEGKRITYGRPNPQ